VIARVQSLAVRALAARYDRNLERRTLLDPGARRHPTLAGPLNFLLIGTTGGVAPETGPRANVVMIGHVAADFDQAHLVAVPRSLRLDAPAHTAPGHPGGANPGGANPGGANPGGANPGGANPGGANPGGANPGGGDVVGAALAGGDGPDAARQLSLALAGLMDIRFDGALIMDLDAMPRVIDLVGGVQVTVPTPVASAETGKVFPPGERRMAGAEALDYAGRHPAADGDPAHHRRHQQLWRATAVRLAELDLVANPLRLDQVVREIGSAVVADINGLNLEELAGALSNLRSRQLSGVEVPVQPPADGVEGHTLPDAEASGLFGSLRNGDLDSWAREHPRWVNRL
jgi:anionic cell wall polymer biosynthesis LytR-Cps2A-Psr (LCP) family protein